MDDLEPQEGQDQDQEASQDSSEVSFSPNSIPPSVSQEVEDPEVDIFDVNLELSDEEKEDIVRYLEDNLPKMRPTTEDVDRIKSYFATYEMAVRKRSFPYENAPSLASSKSYDALNDWLDEAEIAFLQNRITFSIDREEVSFPEDVISRMEKTYHRKFFLKCMSDDLRLILFEASFLGTSIVSVRENFELQPVKEKLVIKTENDIEENKLTLTSAQIKRAQELIADNKPYILDRDTIKVVNIGPIARRVDQTKFWFPRNCKEAKRWQIVSEQEFYTKSVLQGMVEKGEIDGTAFQKMLDTRKALYSTLKDDDADKDDALPESIHYCEELEDSNWRSEKEQIQQYGDSYDDEFAVYRVTLLYKVKTPVNKTGNLRSWIQVLYCPSGSCLLGASFCQDGNPYQPVQYRPVPYNAMGTGIAHALYHHNILDTDLKSLALSLIEQEAGIPILIRKQSGLWASGFRAYPGSTSYTDDVERDVKAFSVPQRTQLAIEGMSMVLGSSPVANKGANYASGKREELIQEKDLRKAKARIHSIALDLDKVFNRAWQIHCRMARFNTDDKKLIDWVYKEAPMNTKLFMLENEMDPKVYWSSILSAVSLTPDARLQDFLRKFEFFYKQQPMLQGNPEKTVNWNNYAADFFGIDENLRDKLLPTIQDFQQYQQQLGAQGGQQEQAASTPEQAQGPATPFHRPPEPPQANQDQPKTGPFAAAKGPQKYVPPQSGPPGLPMPLPK